MTVEPEILEVLRGLRARVPMASGAMAASTDGLVLAQACDEVEPEPAAALTAAALGVALRLAESGSCGDFRELVVRGDLGYVATYAAGPSAVLTVWAGPQTNVGRLHMEARQAGSRVARLLQGALDRAAASVATTKDRPDRGPRRRSPHPSQESEK
ncbi:MULTISPECIES: roadblock/LC7 domain-containing protein [unclassified Streptomyces]|uniref:roadblock/LC7 domain-containing protein n=1 Tax=unclassified Streptomyces TaxID=2593676 RepID=UPI0022B6355A|nr:roadblock/LC7 domain-containing protein [Streptomyces sp. WMMC897]MCZ7415809.1 roadblock/LC7 domain-containing protein [Streptomyces sp. WMMC897]